jgi:membrane protein DedA with SNARE-associated domain
MVAVREERRIPFWPFQIAKFLSAFLWAGALLAPGLFGRKYLHFLS